MFSRDLANWSGFNRFLQHPQKREPWSGELFLIGECSQRRFRFWTDEFITLLAMFWSRNFYVETGLNGHGQNSGWRGTALGRDADRKKSLEQSVEIIGKTGRKKKSLETKKGRIGMNEIEPSKL